MATFNTPVLKLTIEPHPNADKLELAKVGEYRSIVMKGQYQTGDLAVFIPPGALLPQWIIEKLGLVGRLAGPLKNRVKEIRLRSVLSEGLIFPLEDGSSFEPSVERPVFIEGHPDVTELLYVKEGDDVSEFLGITKYEPVIPVCMRGEVCYVDGYPLKYDIENYKKYPDILVENELVTITEKGHGTNFQADYIPDLNNPELIDGNVIVISKGLGAQGLAFKDNEANKDNLYVKTYKEDIINGLSIKERIQLAMTKLEFLNPDTPVYIVAEILGGSVQSGFDYGFSAPALYAFDVYVGFAGKGRYLNENEKDLFFKEIGIKRVPVLYKGPWSKSLIEQYTSGSETISGKEKHMREGIVITPQTERYDRLIGRVILKSVSPEYLTRNDPNATEYS